MHAVPSSTPSNSPGDANADAAVTALTARRVKHARIADRMSDLQALMYPATAGEIILVCGPGGVGKSTLARFMVENAFERNRVQMDSDAGLIPAIFIEAPSCGRTEFDWSRFYSQVLGTLDADLRLSRHAYGVDPKTNRMTVPPNLNVKGRSGQRAAVELALKDRGTKHIIVDEGAHMMEHQSLRQLKNNLNTLKSLANMSGTQIVMTGSYDLFEMINLSGPLARRTQVLHFDRYRQDNDTDVRAFQSCVNFFQKTLPNLFGNQLMMYSDVLHENTLGCVGILRDVLSRAARFMMAAGGWSLEALQRAMLTEAQRNRILKEILEGEEAINPGMNHGELRKNAPRKVA